MEFVIILGEVVTMNKNTVLYKSGNWNDYNFFWVSAKGAWPQEPCMRGSKASCTCRGGTGQGSNPLGRGVRAG